MKTKAFFGMITLLAASLMAQDSSQTDVSNAAQALANQPSYTWTTTVAVPPDAQFQPAPINGKTANGVSSVSTSFRDNALKYVIKGDKAAVYTEDNGWQSLDEMTNRGGRFMVGMIRNFMTPAAQATNLLANAKPLTKAEGAYSADLTDDGAKGLLTFRRGGQATVSDAKGTVKFWVTSGVLSKYEFKVTGTVTYNGNDIDVDRDTTVVISGVGSTTVDVPDDAQKKLQ
jgi:hypothetical protein